MQSPENAFTQISSADAKSDHYSSIASDDIDIFNYLEVIAKESLFITTVTVALAILTVVIVLLLPPVYSSTTRFLPPQQDMNLMGIMMSGGSSGLSSLAGGMLGLGTPADQYASILNSEAISDIIIDRFKLMDVYNKNYRLDMYKKLDNLVDIKAGKKDGIISITVEDKNPRRAAAIANAYVEELGKLSAEINMTGGQQNKHFLEKRLAQSRTDLIKAEEEIKKFQMKNKTIDVTEQAKASITTIAELRAQLALQEIQLAGLSRRFTGNSQEVKDSQSLINKIRKQIEKLEGNGKGGAIPSVGSIPEMGQEYVRLMREFKIQETLVEMLTKQYELAKLTEAKDINTIQVIQTATVPDKKIKPKRALIVVVSTFLSFCCSAMWVLFKDYRNKLSDEELNRWRRIKTALRSKQRAT